MSPKKSTTSSSPAVPVPSVGDWSRYEKMSHGVHDILLHNMESYIYIYDINYI